LDNIVKNIEKNLSYEKGKGDSKQIEQMQKSLNIAKGFHEEVSKYGYYQELLFPNNKSLENLNKYISFNGLEEKNQGNDVSEEKLAYSFILDGSNISRNNQNSKFAKISDVIKCRKKLMEYGIPKENIIILFGAGIRHHIAEIERGQFNNLLKEHNNNQAPKGIDDDYFIIKYALNNDSYIITNDYFKEYQINYPNYKNFLHEHSIRYNVIRNDIIFEPDFEEKLKNIIK